jgi:hypothetical protein
MVIEHTPMTQISTDLLDELLMEAAGPDNTPPRFTPTPDIGEGDPTPTEWEYREEMLLLLGLLFVAISDIQKGRGSGYEKQSRIQAEIDRWTVEAKTRLDTHLDQNHQAGVRDADKQLLRHGLSPMTPQGRLQYYNIIHQQQQSLEMTGQQLSAQLRNNLAVQETEKGYKVPQTEKTANQINYYFKRARNTLDRTAAYGASGAFLEGQMASFVNWEEVLLLDWVTRHDKRVCRTCRTYERRGPYKISKIPFIPHPWCRCYLTISEKVPKDLGMFLPLILTTLDDLENKEE